MSENQAAIETAEEAIIEAPPAADDPAPDTTIPADQESSFLERMFGPEDVETEKKPEGKQPEKPKAESAEEDEEIKDGEEQKADDGDGTEQPEKVEESEVEILKREIAAQRKEAEEAKKEAKQHAERFGQLADLVKKKLEQEQAPDKEQAKDEAERVKSLLANVKPEVAEALKHIMRTEAKSLYGPEIEKLRQADEQRQREDLRRQLSEHRAEIRQTAGDKWGDVEKIFDNALNIVAGGNPRDWHWIAYYAAEYFRMKKSEAKTAEKAKEIRDGKAIKKKSADVNSPKPARAIETKDADALKLPDGFDEMDVKEGIASLLRANMTVKR